MSIPPGTDTEKSSMGGGVPLLNGIAHCSVDINHTLTDWFDVNNGVKQGCILSQWRRKLCFGVGAPLLMLAMHPDNRNKT